MESQQIIDCLKGEELMKKRKSKQILVVTLLLAATAAVGIGSAKWNEKIERSGAEATQLLENEGITIRTVDTTQFVNPDGQINSEKDQKTKPNNNKKTEPNNVQNEVPADQTKTASSEQAGETSERSTKEVEPQQETSSSDKQTKQQKSLNQIKDAYTREFQALESGISANLNTIVNQAIADYQANKQTISGSEFQNKLAANIRQLELTSDQQFNQIYQELEAELVANNYQKSEASPFQAQYRTAKQTREQKAVQKLSQLN